MIIEVIGFRRRSASACTPSAIRLKSNHIYLFSPLSSVRSKVPSPSKAGVSVPANQPWLIAFSTARGREGSYGRYGRHQYWAESRENEVITTTTNLVWFTAVSSYYVRISLSAALQSVNCLCDCWTVTCPDGVLGQFLGRLLHPIWR